MSLISRPARKCTKPLHTFREKVQTWLYQNRRLEMHQMPYTYTSCNVTKKNLFYIFNRLILVIQFNYVKIAEEFAYLV